MCGDINKKMKECNDSKARYQLFCKQHGHIPIFSKAWWMDAVCGPENWDVFLIGTDNDIKAALPYYLKKVNEGKKRITEPLLTQNNGIIFLHPHGQGLIARQKWEEKIINEVCDYIESLGVSGYEQQYHYAFDMWLPFFWRYYQGIVRYTYVIDTSAGYEEVYKGYSSDVRNMLRKAEKACTVSEIEDKKIFYEINKKSFVRQQVDIPYSYEFFCELVQASMDHGACKLLKACDSNGNIHSVAMLVWDETSVYWLLNGTDPVYKNSQANTLLIDAGIRFSCEKRLKFDFEGSVIRGVNHAFREYGGMPMPYFRIKKDFESS